MFETKCRLIDKISKRGHQSYILCYSELQPPFDKGINSDKKRCLNLQLTKRMHQMQPTQNSQSVMTDLTRSMCEPRRISYTYTRPQVDESSILYIGRSGTIDNVTSSSPSLPCPSLATRSYGISYHKPFVTSGEAILGQYRFRFAMFHEGLFTKS